MRRVSLMLAAVVAMVPFSSLAQQAGSYKVLQTLKIGGEGGFDYVYADNAGRKLYVPRSGPSGRVTVFDLDTLKPVGEIANASAHGVAVDAKTQHGFGSSKPVVMFDAKTLATIKTIDVQGGPDGILADPLNGRVYVFSHGAPNVTVIDAKDGSIVGTVDLGGAPEQGVLDGKGHLYIDLEDKGSIAVVDAKTLKVTATYDLQGKGATCAGLAIVALQPVGWVSKTPIWLIPGMLFVGLFFTYFLLFIRFLPMIAIWEIKGVAADASARGPHADG